MKSFASVFLGSFLAIHIGFAQGTEWVDLFDGQSLAGWESTSDATWRVEAGTIVVDDGEAGLLLHAGTYRNYELTLEFQAERGTNSGVFLSTLPKPESLTEDCYELNIAPTDNPFPTGSLVARVKVEGAGESDEWRRFDIRVEGRRVTVSLDGEAIVDYLAEAPAKGDRIGLQKNAGRVAFRNLRVRPLP